MSRNVIVPAFSASPCLAAKHEDNIAKLMHDAEGLKGKLPSTDYRGGAKEELRIEAQNRRREVAKLVKKIGPCSTADIARAMEMTVDKASNDIFELLQRQVLRHHGRRKRNGKMLVEFNDATD